ncbi:mitogen-activated protein kinase 13 [Folsomia candida]|uniref:mitogen-activated protein kinase 13 n=1 Tax=Folsomia candida TaxID=158441 RepID=UPI000B8FF203|nr:mitogen-activated protein kinase 13 [Folsomia candida]
MAGVLENLDLVLGDFGLGRELKEGADKCTTVSVGAKRYRSPEMVLGQGNYNEKTDVFSAAVVFIELILPGGSIDGMTNIKAEVLDLLQQPKNGMVFSKLYADQYPLELKLCQKMAEYYQEKRYSSSQALDRFLDREMFLQELETEKKFEAMVRYNVPFPRWKFFGRDAEVKKLEDCLILQNFQSVWIDGIIGS